MKDKIIKNRINKNIGNNIYKNTKNSKGITLVALVVTIIVLIILATVSISLVLGNNGIITKTREGKENYEQASENERIGLNTLFDEMENEINKSSSGPTALEIIANATKPNGQVKDGVRS